MAGARSRNVGRETEQLVARYLRGRGLAGVERAVRTGYRTAGGRHLADAGDLTGIPGVCVQVKSLRPATEAERHTELWLAETEQQRAASGASVGLLVVRRWGTTDVGRWWGFLHLRDLYGMADGYSGQLLAGPPDLLAAPMRLQLADVVTLLQVHGWAPAAPVAG